MTASRNPHLQCAPGVVRHLTAITAVLILFACSAGAATYYVSTAGSDANPGTQAQPWRHIDYGDANGKLAPGDTVEVEAGTYNDSGNPWGQVLILFSSGTPTQPITYHANGQVVIDGTNYLSTFPNIGVHFGANYIVLDGFEITNCARGAYLGGDPSAGKQGVVIKNCRFHDLAPVIPGDPSMENSICCGIYDSWGGPNTFHHNVFYYIGYAGYVPDNPEGNNNWSFAIGGPALNGNLIYNNTMSDSWCGIRTWVGDVGRSVTVKNNLIINMWGYAIANGQGSAGMTESHNLLYSNYENYSGLAAPGYADFVADPQIDWDFTLLATSPAVNAGVDVGLPATGLPDIGGIESSHTEGPGFALGTVTNGGWAVTYRPPQPIPWLRVECEAAGSHALTAADGSYRLPLPAGLQTVQASYAFAEPQTADLTIVANTAINPPKDFAMLPEPGVTYYVDPNGDDNSPDPTSPATPWRTIERADGLGVLLPGDTVVAAPGIYPQVSQSGIVLTNTGGNIVAPVIYKCSGPGKAVVTAADTGSNGMIIAQHLQNVVVDGFEFSGGQMGINLGGTGPAYVGTHDNVITNCAFHGQRPPAPDSGPWSSWCAGVYSSAAWNNWYYNNVFYDIGIPGKVPNNPDNNNNWSGSILAPFCVENKVFNNVMDGSWAAIMAWETCQNNTIRNNIVTNMWGGGFKLPGGPVTNSNNLFYNNSADYQGVAAYGPGDLGGNPQFVGGGDYHVQTTSPAVNTGYDVGLAYTGPAKDIGAFETSSTTAVGTVTGKVTANQPNHPPVPEAKVGKPDNSIFAFSAADGTYSLKLPAGTYSLQASAFGFASLTKTNIPVPANGTRPNINFDLTATAGRTFYVNGETGDDANDGLSTTTAWKTIGNGDASGKLYPGDVVEVAAGTYTGGDSWGVVKLLTKSGNSAAQITYKANGRVVIDGKSLDGVSPHIGFHLGVNYITLDGFELQNLGAGIYLSGSPGSGRIGTVVKNCVIHDMYPVRAGDPVNDTGATMFESLSCGIYDSWASGPNTFHHNLIYNVGVFPRVPDNPEGNNNWSFGIGGPRVMDQCYNNTIINTWRAMQTWVGAYTPAGLVDARNNIILDTWGGGFSVESGYTYMGGNNLFWNVANPLYAGAALPAIGDIVGDPALDAAYKPQANSAAVDSGADLGLGWTFKGLAPDVGWYESDFTLSTADSLVAAKKLAPGTRVKLTSAQAASVNSSTFTDGSYYIEETGRQTGIKVIPNAANVAVLLGDRITLIGVVGTDANDEPVISIESITSVTAGDPLATLGVPNKSVLAAGGASVSGVLVRLWGQVTYKDPAGSYIYVDDGSNLNDGSGQTGIRVMLNGLITPLTTVIPDSPLPYVTITGVVGQVKDGGDAIPAIRLRGDADLVLR